MSAMEEDDPQPTTKAGDKPNVSGNGTLVSTAPLDGFEAVTEGKAKVLFPATVERSVFYNKAQIVNRDLSILVIKVFQEVISVHSGVKRGANEAQKGALHILEALSASGLRSIRYWKEIPGIHRLVVNDLSPDAYTAIVRNLNFNEVPIVSENNKAEDIVYPKEETAAQAGLQPICEDAVVLMMKTRPPPIPSATSPPPCRFNVIDLDPYGTAVPFLDSAVQGVEEGGLMCVTCTDLAVLCGTYPETCHAKYGALCVKGKYCHEMAVRILLGHIETVCNKYGRYIVPLLSLCIDFYCRVFIRVYTGRGEVKFSLKKLSHVLQCNMCSTFHLQPVGKVSASKGSQMKDPSLKPANKKRKTNTDETSKEEPAAETTKEEKKEKPKELSMQEKLKQVGQAISGKAGVQTGGLRFNAATFTAPDKCEVCGQNFWIGGPIYTDPIHSVPFVKLLIEHLEKNKEQFGAYQRVMGLITLAEQELTDCPLFHHLPNIASHIKTSVPPIARYRNALIKLGYRVSSVHCDAGGIKTDAPNTVLYDLMKIWRRDHVTGQQKEQQEQSKDSAKKKENKRKWDKKGKKKSDGGDDDGAPSFKEAHQQEIAKLVDKILSVEPQIKEADFSYNAKCDISAGHTGVAKFPQNAPNWGPMARPKGTAKAINEQKEGEG